MSLAAQVLRRTALVPLAALLVAGCATSQAADALDDEASAEPSSAKSDEAIDVATPLPQESGTFRARYVVPASIELADAASFPIDIVSWQIEDGLARLRYALPEGLVGGHVEVDLSGPLEPGATVVELTSAQGSGRCTATATTLICREAFGDLGELPMSLEVVRRVAARDFAGPIAHREAVANLFGSDPIGAVELDLSAPAGTYPADD